MIGVVKDVVGDGDGGDLQLGSDSIDAGLK